MNFIPSTENHAHEGVDEWFSGGIPPDVAQQRRLRRIGTMSVRAWGSFQFFLIVFVFSSLLKPVHVQAAEDEAAKGRELYLTYGCAVCHGKDGKGDGISSQKSYPPPTNFYDINAYGQGHDKDSIRHSIQYGVKEVNSIMPAFGHIPTKELVQLSAYIESLQAAPAADPGTDIAVHDAWVQAMPPSQQTTAAYMTVENASDHDVVLESASADIAAITEIHQMSRKDGMMRMGMAKAITIPAKGNVAFEHGGYHIMLINLKKPVNKGDNIPMSLHFKGGREVKVEAVVRDE